MTRPSRILRNASLLTMTVIAFVAYASPDHIQAGEAGKKYLIIHADDAGMSHSVNVGTIEAMEQGVVSSASIMVPCPWFKEFAAYARKHPNKDYGIHLTLNSEWKQYRWGPVAGAAKVPSLVDKEGYLWGGVRAVAANVKAHEVEIELRAQIDRAKEFGVPLTHLDTHMGALFSRPDLVEVYVNLGIEYGLPVLFIRDVPNSTAKAYPGLAARAQQMVRALDTHHFPVLDHIGQFYGGDDQQSRKIVYLKELRSLKPGVSELIIHCGVDNAELRAITNSAPNRNGDRVIFTDPEVKAEIEKLGIEVITWKQFHEMTAQDKVAE